MVKTTKTKNIVVNIFTIVTLRLEYSMLAVKPLVNRHSNSPDPISGKILNPYVKGRMLCL